MNLLKFKEIDIFCVVSSFAVVLIVWQMGFVESRNALYSVLSFYSATFFFKLRNLKLEKLKAEKIGLVILIFLVHFISCLLNFIFKLCAIRCIEWIDCLWTNARKKDHQEIFLRVFLRNCRRPVFRAAQLQGWMNEFGPHIVL